MVLWEDDNEENLSPAPRIMSNWEIVERLLIEDGLSKGEITAIKTLYDSSRKVTKAKSKTSFGELEEMG